MGGRIQTFNLYSVTEMYGRVTHYGQSRMGMCEDTSEHLSIYKYRVLVLHSFIHRQSTWVMLPLMCVVFSLPVFLVHLVRMIISHSIYLIIIIISHSILPTINLHSLFNRCIFSYNLPLLLSKSVDQVHFNVRTAWVHSSFTVISLLRTWIPLCCLSSTNERCSPVEKEKQ